MVPWPPASGWASPDGDRVVAGWVVGLLMCTPGSAVGRWIGRVGDLPSVRHRRRPIITGGESDCGHDTIVTVPARVSLEGGRTIGEPVVAVAMSTRVEPWGVDHPFELPKQGRSNVADQD
ncbi:hypothetical protein GCM10010210_34300 [Pseudonocardia hydrocarbonoxydans]|uniref:Uncharacterized protein n=1 Tax=Pseudonocardia hydrocarbonoxydans TaxID=76726 RepID=A0A4Y3WU57_9PSEU|nr:hypothetical protein PHY01_46560 [Pseudonocardia hydrocarbonoxydans]